MHGVEQVGAAGDRGERHAAGDPFAIVTMSGHHALVFAGEPVPVRANPVWTSSAMKTTPLRWPNRPARRKPGAGR